MLMLSATDGEPHCGVMCIKPADNDFLHLCSADHNVIT